MRTDLGSHPRGFPGSTLAYEYPPSGWFASPRASPRGVRGAEWGNPRGEKLSHAVDYLHPIIHEALAADLREIGTGVALTGRRLSHLSLVR